MTSLRGNINDEMTVHIIDWDNTLFPTQFLMALADYDNVYYHQVTLTDEEKELFAQLETHILEFLEACSRQGSVAIVTTADSEWISLVTRAYMPRLVDYLNRVLVICAKTPPFQVGTLACHWKYLAFEHVLRLNPGTTQVTSLGDSQQEKMAMGGIRRAHPDIHCRSIKTLSNPSPVELLDQLRYLTGVIDALPPDYPDLMVLKIANTSPPSTNGDVTSTHQRGAGSSTSASC